MRRSLAAALLSLSLASPAAADDLAPPPEDCPRGSVGTTEHAGEWCTATRCASDDDCTPAGLRRQGVDQYHAAGAMVCREVALCVLEESYTLGGLWPDEPPTATRRIARGACVDGRCPAGGECGAERRCVLASEPAPAAPSAAPPPATPADPPAESDARGSGCAVGHGAAGLLWWAMGLLLFAIRPVSGKAR
ncbi:MAG: hypothetical protein H6719_19940 [Sandaracinaceae bacterium]|nr:hypothetical protein [Sandaracinaceae bacterium]